MKYLFLIGLLSASQAFAFGQKEIRKCAKSAHLRAKNMVLAAAGLAKIDFEKPDGDMKFSVKGNEIQVNSTFEYLNTISTSFVVDSTIVIDDPVDGPSMNCATKFARVKIQNK